MNIPKTKEKYPHVYNRLKLLSEVSDHHVFEALKELTSYESGNHKQGFDKEVFLELYNLFSEYYDRLNIKKDIDWSF